ncbi:Spy0128 family protein [Thomasclavelia cocleata]|uniref:Spy0128 family protein n=1 Tax=Thomasclavelia cocleata TaxID=69824 RepID=UPI00242EB6FA|nr:FctA domain-containing protein [Thomasclavelia cocleata]
MKKKRFKGFIACLSVFVVVLSIILANVSVYAEASTDANTLTRWVDSIANNTKNMGRIWTDKTVSSEDKITLQATDKTTGNPIVIDKGDSAFLVGLSALGSSGVIRGEIKHSLPLDIVLVLDNSKSAGEVDAGTGDGRKRWDVLKDATKSFIDKTQEMNASLSDGEIPHRIAMVTTAANGNLITNNFENCSTESEAEALKRKIESTGTGSSFKPDNGLEVASGVLDTSTAERVKIVLYFATGQHSGGNDVNPNVLNKGINLAKGMKADSNTRIFSVATFGAGDATTPPKTTASDFDLFMHGISNNYLTPSAYNNLGKLNINEAGENPSYYKTAKDSVELESIFEKIIQDVIETEAIPPTDSTDDQGSITAITFHDELGDYMKLDGLKGISFANNKYTEYSQVSSNSEDGCTTIVYRYESHEEDADINPIYPDGNVNDIIITVKSYADLAKGDKITVEVPANMIPLKYYDVDIREGKEAMTINDTYPLRMFYGVSVKEGVEDRLARPDEVMKQYIEKNVDENNKVRFFSNKYYGENSENKGVYVEFRPNKENDFYYFQLDQHLYTDKDCTAYAREDLDINNSYYYKRVYYEIVDGKPVLKDNIVKLDSNSLLLSQGYVKKDSNNYLYIPKGTPRLTSLNNYITEKTTNITGTSPYIVKPGWVNAANNPVTVNVELGNNGYVGLDIPGSLAITKEVTAGEGLTAPEKEFSFNLTLINGEVEDKTYTAQIYDQANNKIGDEFLVTKNDTFKLKADQRIEIYGLEADTDYTVTEIDLPAGFEKTSGKENGKINSGEMAQSIFINAYEVDSLKVTSEQFGLDGQKKLDGREFKDGDNFKFYIRNSANAPTNQPLPTQPECIINPKSGNEAGITFGEFEFTKPDTYIYIITEYIPQNGGTEIIPGVTYDTSAYRLTVNVEDDQAGKLKISNVKIEKTSRIEDEGHMIWDEIYNSIELPNQSKVEFINEFIKGQQAVSLTGTKVLENKKLADYNNAEQFKFLFEAVGVKDEAGNYISTPDQPMPENSIDGVYTFHNLETGGIVIPEITFTSDYDGNEYRYNLIEWQPTNTGRYDGQPLDGAVKNSDGKWVYKGVTFENHVHVVDMTVIVETDENNGEVVKVAVKHDGVATGEGANKNFIFTNVYNASTSISLSGTKELSGRDFVMGDEFKFDITPINDAPVPVDGNGNKITQVVINPTSGQETNIDFGKFGFDIEDMTDAKNIAPVGQTPIYEKTFTYKIKEVKGTAGGMKYDTAERTIQIKVTDDGFGNMTAELVSAQSDLVWSNTYSAVSPVYGGLNITKTLNGRSLKTDEFTFTVTPIDGTAGIPFIVTNGPANEGLPNVMKVLNNIKFTEADSGKTFTYEIREEQGNKGGITYDSSIYKVAITVKDNYDGTLSYNTIITKDENEIFNGNGGNVNKPIAFINEYKANPVTIDGRTQLKITKGLIGRDWVDTDSFTFNIKRTDNNDADAVNMSDPKIITVDKTKVVANNEAESFFGDIIFNKAGIYQFTITEEEGNIPGIKYDISPKIITVEVTDNGEGSLEAEITGNQNLKFLNWYIAEEGKLDNLSVKKVLEGRDWKNTDTFTFEIIGNNQNTLDAIENGEIDITNPEVSIKNDTENNTIVFEDIIFYEAGEYEFAVIEKQDNNISGIEYDNTVKVIKVSVIDNGVGNLVTTVKGVELPLVFINKYKVTPTMIVGVENLKVTKNFTGRDWLDSEFIFNITANGATQEAIAAGKVILDNDRLIINEGNKDNASFGDITFKEAGTYEFTIREEEGSIPGVTYDTTPRTIIVNVVDNNGELKASIVEESDKLEFNNTYAPNATKLDGSTNLKVTKNFTGRDWLESDEFRFIIGAATDDTATIDAVEAGEIILPGDLVINNANKDSGNFGDIEFTKAGTYKFVITEVLTDIPGVTYDTTSRTITVNVEDNNGKLEAVLINEESDLLTFNNTYVPDETVLNGETNLKVTKNFTGRENDKWIEGDIFIFDLAADMSDPVTAEAYDNGNIILGSNSLIVQSGNKNDAYFEDITFKTTGTYKFIISEVDTKIPGVIYDSTPKTIIVNVVDNNKGELVASVIEGSDKLEFNNTYVPTETVLEGETNLKVTKNLTGRDWLGTDEFRFTISAATDDTATIDAVEAGEIILPGDLVINNANKDSASFGNITFKEAGTYKFVVSEEEGTISGVTYDTTPRTIIVNVVDNNKGELVASVIEGSDKLEFNNTYVPTETVLEGETNLKVTKNLTGRDWLGTDEFRFTISAATDDTATIDAVEAGEIILPGDLVINNANKDSASFGNITFKEAGTYKFVVSEEEGSIQGVTYDNVPKIIIVNVIDNKDGTMSASIVEESDKLEFNNTYAPTETVLEGETNLKVTKNLTGRDWLGTDEFRFTISAATDDTATIDAVEAGEIILPGDLVINNANKDSASFGNITFKEAGTYKFVVSEEEGTISGVTYDTTPRTIIVNVVDNNKGELVASVIEGSDKLEFNNTYVPTETVLEGETNLKVTKNLTGRDWLGTDEFRFTISAATDDTATIDAVEAGEIILPGDLVINNANKDSASFGNITFKEAGTYKFVVSEEEGTISGVTYDTTPRTIIVNVVDNNKGELVASVIEGSDKLEFNNTYVPTETVLEGETNLKVTKNLTGRDWLGTDEFRFTISAATDDTATIDAVEAGEIILPGDLVINNANKDSASFGNITFKEAGTYKFVVSEEEGTIPGVSYDNVSKTIIVNVVDNNKGQLMASVIEGSDKLEFNNVYIPTEAALEGKTNLKVTKNFTGRINDEWRADDIFGFVLEANVNDLATKEALEQGNIVLPENTILAINKKNKDNAYFDNITFKVVGTYRFTVKEMKGDIAGVAYDETIKNIVVEVIDDNTGKLKANVIEGSDLLTFNNIYAPLPATLVGTKNLVVTKEFTGRVNNEWLDTDIFTFNLIATDETLETGGVEFLGNTEVIIDKNSNTASFGDIKFTKPGDYTFKVIEVNGNISGVDYDLDERIITVKAIDKNDGTMDISIEGTDDLIFENVYRTENVDLDGKTNLNISKVLEGRNWNDTDSFIFELKASDDVTKAAVEDGKINLPEETLLTLTKNLQTSNFGDITFKAVGTYTFEISEIKGNIERVGYDSHKTIISVEVTDNNEGKLVVATPTVTGEMTFTNKYTPAPVTATLEGIKVMSGRDLKDTDKFEFTIEGIDNAPMPQVTTVKNNKDKISFAPINYTEAGTYEYTIKETGGSATSVTNDSGVVHATVKVVYDMNTGILTPEVTYVKEGGKGEGFTFINEYKAIPITLANGFSAIKEVKPTDGNSYEMKGGEFEFMIAPSQNNPTSDPIKETIVTNDVNGNITFATNVKYSEAGIYVYDVKEISGTLGGMSYDDTIYTITVKVTDNQIDGKLEAEVSMTVNDKNVDSIKFTNSYNPKAVTAIISGKKILDGKELVADAFAFNIKTTNNAPMPEKKTVTNSAAGLVQFDEITYDKPGEYHYQITEVNDGKEGYTYDDTIQNVIVKVTDNNGELKSEIVNNEFVFNNIYKAAPISIGGDTNIKVGAIKKLDGRKLNEKEFEFELHDQSGAVVATAVNDKKGNLYFSELRFEEVGTYYFTMIEKNNNLGGVTYDQNTYLLEVVITDEGGHLEAKVRYIGDGDKELDTVVFNNSYKAAPTSIQLGATKILNGRDLRADEFTFVLKDKDGKIVSEASNNINGLIQFDKFNFDKAGTYQYTIAEVNSDDETIIYDNSLFTATIKVTDDGKGNLNAEIEYDKTPVFTNEVKAKDPSSVGTDDKYGYGYEYLGALTISMLGGMALYVQRKKRVTK